MRLASLAAAFGLLALPAAAQQNPFRIAGSSVKSARVTYAVTVDGKPRPATVELLISGDQYVMRTADVMEIGGKRDSTWIYARLTPDSTYRWSGFGRARAPGEAEPALRRQLAAAYDALDAAGKRRVVENLRALSLRMKKSLDDVALTVGEPAGTGSYAGERCDRYRNGTEEYCVVPGSNMVALFWSSDGGKTVYTATSVKLNAPITAARLAPPPGVRFRPKDGLDAEELFGEIYMLEHPDAEAPPTPAEAARAVVSFLARPDAVQRLRQESGGEDEESEPAGAAR
ncbi:MAG TPA: hypothetical protein VFS05_02525 [Gemmatimonadaceae bacterium]|nr:hypothetical protein [Gemmatimonadaceae bacterium]